MPRYRVVRRLTVEKVMLVDAPHQGLAAYAPDAPGTTVVEEQTTPIDNSVLGVTEVPPDATLGGA